MKTIGDLHKLPEKILCERKIEEGNKHAILDCKWCMYNSSIDKISSIPVPPLLEHAGGLVEALKLVLNCHDAGADLSQFGLEIIKQAIQKVEGVR